MIMWPSRVGIYRYKPWDTFYYYTRNCMGGKTIPWHWVQYYPAVPERGVQSRWCYCSGTPVNLEQSSALEFLLLTGEMLKPEELEAYAKRHRTKDEDI